MDNTSDDVQSPTPPVGSSFRLLPPMTAKNYYLHKLYLRQEFPECLKLIEDMLKEHQGLCEYPIYVKGTYIYSIYIYYYISLYIEI